MEPYSSKYSSIINFYYEIMPELHNNKREKYYPSILLYI
jgi:hypothetical protein